MVSVVRGTISRMEIKYTAVSILRDSVLSLAFRAVGELVSMVGPQFGLRCVHVCTHVFQALLYSHLAIYLCLFLCSVKLLK